MPATAARAAGEKVKDALVRKQNDRGLAPWIRPAAVRSHLLVKIDKSSRLSLSLQRYRAVLNREPQGRCRPVAPIESGGACILCTIYSQGTRRMPRGLAMAVCLARKGCCGVPARHGPSTAAGARDCPRWLSPRYSVARLHAHSIPAWPRPQDGPRSRGRAATGAPMRGGARRAAWLAAMAAVGIYVKYSS